MLGGSGAYESFEAGHRLGCFASERVGLADFTKNSFHKRNLVWGWYIWANMYIWTVCHTLLLEDKATVCLHSDTRTESMREGVSEPLEASGLSMADLLAFFHP